MNSPPHTWFPLQQVLCLDGSDLRHGGEDVGAVGGSPLYAVAVVDLSITCLLVHIELNGTERDQFSDLKCIYLEQLSKATGTLLFVYTVPQKACYRSPHFQHTDIVPAEWHGW